MARGFNYAPGASDEVGLAGSPALQRAQITALAQSRNALVREVLAKRSDLGLGQMVTLAHDRSADVRAALAANPIAPLSVLEHFAEDKHMPVLEALLTNPTTPPEIVERLAFHKKSEVRMAAARRIDADSSARSQWGTTADAGTQLSTHAPEIQEHAVQDNAVGFGEASVFDISTGRPLPPQATPPPPAPRPTRTAPVRGFRPPSP